MFHDPAGRASPPADASSGALLRLSRRGKSYTLKAIRQLVNLCHLLLVLEGKRRLKSERDESYLVLKEWYSHPGRNWTSSIQGYQNFKPVPFRFNKGLKAW